MKYFLVIFELNCAYSTQMYFRFLIFVIIFFLVGCRFDSTIKNNNDSTIRALDSIFSISLNNELPDSVRIHSLKIANIKIKNVSNDSLKFKLLLKLAHNNLNLGNVENFGKINLNILNEPYMKLATMNDKALVFEYLGYYYGLKFSPDSSYYFYDNALKSYKKVNNESSEGRVFLNLATILSSIRDYTRSEIYTIKAIEKLQYTNDNRNLYLAYNNLAVISNELNKFDESIEYRKKGLSYLSKLNNVEELILLALNGIGISYQKKGNWLKSIDFFKKAGAKLATSKKLPKILAAINDNLAYSKFKLNQTDELPELFYKALKIRDSLNIKDGQVVSNLHLSEYYLSQKDTLKAIRYGNKAKEIAEEANYSEGLFNSISFLSKIVSPEKGVKYLQKYVKLLDSLQQQEREIREKFTRIAYETDEITKENKVITKKNWWLTIAIIIGCAFFTVIYFYIRQRSKNKELLFNQKQEEANVEIYNLMISEKTKFEEGSIKERNRISEELHDGIVNKLFALRLRLLLLNEGKTKKDMDVREKHLEELQNIEEEIRTVSHELKVELFNVDNSFEKMVKDLVIKRSNLSNFEWNLSFNIHRKWESVANKIKIHCYRTIQEALQNIHKYAQATEVEIRFIEDEQLLLVEIIDNGIGFNPKNKSNGIGLKNIESRILKLNGTIEILSSIGEGTKIIMNIPL
ncbi:ATP-binding protein [Lutibacter sp. A64]|uniref:tetratricopeptide repeat-containing sensor histidine kinase n=1 Tax=Lutibacter sp. A64 TaxID=2918526 RepID=UPI001F0572D1|nr:sensor histidine kinase [Lutibacter sp. A64]UMB53917.1 ATP-binding protein [Lutibacter sp. A64]